MKWFDLSPYQKRHLSKWAQFKLIFSRVWRRKVRTPLERQRLLASGQAMRVGDRGISIPGTQDPKGFFVGCNECISMGVCQAEAPGLIEWDDAQGVSRVVRQPETDEEIRLMADAVIVCAADAIRYGGNDPNVLKIIRANALYDPQARFTWLGRLSRRFYSSRSSR